MLSASNLWQYGRFLSGGYNTGRLANGLIRGSLKEGFKKSKGAVAKQYARALSNPFAAGIIQMLKPTVVSALKQQTIEFVKGEKESSNKQTNIVVAFIIARNSKGNENKVIIAKKIRIV